MIDEAVDLDVLIGAWRLALEAAQDALRAGRHDFPRPSFVCGANDSQTSGARQSACSVPSPENDT